MEAILPLHSEVEDFGVHPYVLDPADSVLDEVLMTPILCFCVLKRLNGLLLAIPNDALSDEALEDVFQAAPGDMIGPSHLIETDGVSWDWSTLQTVPGDVGRVAVLLVDFSTDVAPLLKDAMDYPDFASVTGFAENLQHVPVAGDLVTAALEWVSNPLHTSGRVTYYSAEENVPEVPAETAGVLPTAKAKTKVKVPNGGTPGGGEGQRPRKKPTVASLAESMEKVLGVLPQLTQQMQELTQRQVALESSPTQGRASALRQPLGAFPSHGSLQTPPLSSLVQDMPPPRNTSQEQTRQPISKNAELETAELLQDVDVSGQSDLARAVLAQSQALTALVSQIAGSTSDPIQDLAGASSSVSSRGAAGRAKLQAELAQQRGLFHQSVMQSMARRMQPALSAETNMTALRDRGVTATRYLERFGGFGKVKEYGHIAWQLGLIMDFLQEDNLAATKDAVALLLVCLEQTALDAGRMELGLMLTLAEEPPQALFSNRSLAQGSRPMAFAPLADQRWVTTSLQYLKEPDTIASRRSETGSPSKENKGNQPDKTGQPNPKKKQKGGGKGKQRTEEEAE